MPFHQEWLLPKEHLSVLCLLGAWTLFRLSLYATSIITFTDETQASPWMDTHVRGGFVLK